MKATVSRKEFADALAIASSASSTRSALPVLTSIRLEAGESALHLLGCDGEMWASAMAPANVEAPGAVCVQAKLLSEITGALPAGDVTIEIEGTSVYLRQGFSEWKMMAMQADEFPPMPAVEAVSELTLPMGELRSAVEAVDYAVSEDSSRPVLTGLLFTYDGKTLTLVATDTHRLAVNHLHREGIGSAMSAIVPDRALRTIRSLPVDEQEPIVVRFDESRLSVDVGTAKVVSQLLSGTYPNWERVVPSESTRSWTMDRQELVDTVKRAEIMARDSAFRIRFKGMGDTVQISARSEDRGEAKEEVSCVSKNGDFEIAFNCRYVRDALQAMSSDGVRAEMTEASRPAVFRPSEGGENRFCVVMPMALG